MGDMENKELNLQELDEVSGGLAPIKTDIPIVNAPAVKIGNRILVKYNNKPVEATVEKIFDNGGIRPQCEVLFDDGSYAIFDEYKIING